MHFHSNTKHIKKELSYTVLCHKYFKFKSKNAAKYLAAFKPTTKDWVMLSLKQRLQRNHINSMTSQRTLNNLESYIATFK